MRETRDFGEHGKVSGESSFIETYAKIVQESRVAEREWIEKLRKQGVKASHPNDGWIDRENKIAKFSYPQFNDGVNAGDKIALGRHNDYKIVTILEVIENESSWLLADVSPRKYLYTEESKDV